MSSKPTQISDSPFARKDGSAMVAAIFIAVVIGLWMAATLQSSFTEYKMSKRYLDMQSAMNLAESGLEEGIRAFNSGDWTGWTEYSNGYYKSETPWWLGGGLTGAIKIYVTKNATSPSVAAEGSVTDLSGISIKKQVRVDLSGSSLFSNGLLAREKVEFSGNNILVDSYHSDLGVYTPSSFVNRNSEGSVASLSLVNLDIDVNNGDIRGYVATGASSWTDTIVGKNGSVYTYTWSVSDGGDLDGDGKTSNDNVDNRRTTTDFYADLPIISVPSTSGYTDKGAITASTTLGSPTATSPDGYIASSISLTGTSGSATLTIAGPVRLYVSGETNITGNGMIDILPGGSLELFAMGNVKIAGNGMANPTTTSGVIPSGKPENAIIYGVAPESSNQTIELGGNAILVATVYAPNAAVDVHGGGSDGIILGAIVGKSINLRGGVEFHYDEALKDLNGGAGLSIKLWRELREAGERLPFDTPASLPTYF